MRAKANGAKEATRVERQFNGSGLRTKLKKIMCLLTACLAQYHLKSEHCDGA